MGTAGSKSFGPPVVMGSEALMAKKGHGSCSRGVQESLRWNVDQAKADKICCFNRHYAEYSSYFTANEVTWLKEVPRDAPTEYYDSVFGKLCFTAPKGRSFAEFLAESRSHGWPSFRDEETRAATDIKGCLASRDDCGDIHDVDVCDDDKGYEGYEASFLNRSLCDQCRVCGDVCHGTTIEQTGFGISTARLGVLQAVFMIGYVLGAFIFGHLVSRVKPFRLISLGLALWVVASFLSGFSGFWCVHNDDNVCSSYYLMVFGRALSGVGEASLNTLSLPFLDDILAPDKKGFYIGIYYAAIPVGTAFGFMWAGTVSSLTGGVWEYAFIVEAPIMVPFVILSYFVPFEYKLNPQAVPLASNQSHRDPDSSSDSDDDDDDPEGLYETDERDHSSAAVDTLSAIAEADEERSSIGGATTEAGSPRTGLDAQDLTEPLMSESSRGQSTDANRPTPLLVDESQSRAQGSSRRLISPTSRTSSHRTPRRVSLRAGILACLRRPAFVLGALGYAVYTGVVAGLGFYGPSFLQNYRACDPRWHFSQTQADIFFGLMISASGLLGTLLGGYMVDQIKSNSLGQKNRNDMLHQILIQVICGFLGSALALMMAEPVVFFIFLFFGSVSIFMVSSGINMMLMWTVPKACRPMQSALTVLTIHLLGDVPSPIFIGWVSDNFGPLITLAVTVSLLLICVVLWSCILPLPEEVPRRKYDPIRELQRRRSSMGAAGS
ncbi:Protein spinster [Hondaea fermentalgiana]|uniref:Protein spinster n=1 Tax=Hondaea fermentalgiana TaxID=2315210 RepID=A0A2R5G5Z7_9STRA|nr:Protein spinster [Hondaea fermentalgiana]|eukprot:GBG25198.1 Protein spinster [Hondaea fermentalgiana]